MELPFGQAESPLAGPSRARLQARQHRNSALKPYDRRSLVADGTPGRGDSSALSVKSAKSKADRESIKGGGVGLLSGLRQAIFSRPLSWLQGTSAAKTASSSSALPSYASPVLSAAQKLAASVTASSRPDDIETHANGIAGTSKTIAPPTPNFNTTRQSIPAAFAYTPARSPSPARSSASAAIQSHGRQRLSVGPPLQSPKFGGSTLGTPGYRRGGSLRPDSGSINGLAASQSSPSFAFGFGSERRLAGISSAVSAHSHFPLSPLAPSSSYNPLPSRSPFAMNRQSLAESSAGGSVVGYDRSPRVGGLHNLTTPSRSRPNSLFGGEFSRSRAGSVADSRMSTSSQTPRRRDWSSLKMAPPKADMSAGEELMQAYLAMRNGSNVNDATAHPALQNGAGLSGTDTLMMKYGAGSSSQRHSGLYDDASLKRGVSMSIDGDDTMSEVGPRKRQKQMVWDSELGFVSKEDLRASRPAKPVAQNEAERLLNALEGLRAPVAGSIAREGSSRGTPMRQMMPVSVPLPVPERSEINVGARQKNIEDLSKTVSPYSRALRSKMSQSVEPEEGKGLRSRLRRPADTGAKTGKKGQAIENEETLDESMGRGESDEEHETVASEGEAEVEEEEEDIVEPPRRKLVAPIDTEKRTLRSGKVLPPSPAKRGGASITSPLKIDSTSSMPMSKARLEISASGASAVSRQKAGQVQPTAPVSSEVSQFQIRSDVSMERTRSSLRQGAEKTHRSHVKSGRVGLDDDDDDDEVDDLPSAEELNKIKLPTNLFPQGFTFSGSSSPLQGSNGSSPAPFKAATSSNGPALKVLPAPLDDTEKERTEETSNKQSQEVGPAGGSLLGRLGGFAPAPQPIAETPKAATPSFSFTAPSATSEKPLSASKPLFSFQSSSKSSTSDFFSAPASSEKEPASSASTPPVARKDGPIPNFFASSIAKTGSQEGSDVAPAVAPSFSFVKPAEVKAPEVIAAPATTPSFSFGAPTSSGSSESSNMFSAPSQPITFGKAAEPSTATPSFSFTPKTADKEKPVTFQGFGKPMDSAKDSNQATPFFEGFNSKPADPAAQAAPGFSFSTPASTSASFPSFSADVSKKRGAEEQDGGPLKKSNGFTPPPSFGFNSPTANSFKPQGGGTESKAAVPSPSDNFSFGGAGKSEMMDTSPSSALNGSNAFVAASSPTPASSKPAFSFGAPASSSASSSSVPATSQAGFSFGMTSQAKPSSTTTATPSFNFGGNAQATSNSGGGNPFGQSSAAAPASNPFGAPSNTPSTGGFGTGFGASGNTADGSRQGSPAPFAFGGAPTQAVGGGFGSGFGQNTGTAQSMSVSSPPVTPAFAFGASSAVSAPTTPGAGNSSGFSFSMPNANSGASNSFGMPTNEAAPGQASPFVFGSSSGTSTPPQSQPGGGGFGFNMGASAPQSPAGNSLFNLGTAPPPGPGGNRPLRGMPARRKR